MYCNKTKVMLQQGIRIVFYVLQYKQWSVLQQGIRTVFYVLQYKQWSVLQQGIRTCVLYIAI